MSRMRSHNRRRDDDQGWFIEKPLSYPKLKQLDKRTQKSMTVIPLVDCILEDQHQQSGQIIKMSK
jgi:hypothetical protein